VDPRNHVLDGVQILHGKDKFQEKGRPIVKYRDTLLYELCKNGLTDLIPRITWISQRMCRLCVALKMEPTYAVKSPLPKIPFSGRE